MSILFLNISFGRPPGLTGSQFIMLSWECGPKTCVSESSDISDAQMDPNGIVLGTLRGPNLFFTGENKWNFVLNSQKSRQYRAFGVVEHGPEQ